MAMHSGSLPRNVLETGLNHWFGLGYEEEKQFVGDQVFDRGDITTNLRPVVEEAQMIGLGVAQDFKERTSHPEDQFNEGWVASYRFNKVGLSYSYGEELKLFNQYDNLGKFEKHIGLALRRRRELDAMGILLNGFDTNYAGGDGKPLFALDHPTWSAGDQANMTSAAALGEDQLEDLLVLIRNLEDDRGNPTFHEAAQVILPPQLEYDFYRIVKSSQRVATADNDTNAIAGLGRLQGDPIITSYLKSAPTAYYIKTTCPDGLKYFEARGVETFMKMDEDSKVMKRGASGYWVHGWTDWRGIVANAGS